MRLCYAVADVTSIRNNMYELCHCCRPW